MDSPYGCERRGSCGIDGSSSKLANVWFVIKDTRRVLICVISVFSIPITYTSSLVCVCAGCVCEGFR